MTIDQTEVILTAFEREIAKHKASLEANEKEWAEDGCFDLDVFNSMCEEKDRIAIWEHAAAIVSRVAGEVKP
jgi:hypothetical protein